MGDLYNYRVTMRDATNTDDDNTAVIYVKTYTKREAIRAAKETWKENGLLDGETDGDLEIEAERFTFISVDLR